MSKFRLGIVLIVLIAVSIQARSQSYSGSLTGVVLDPSGAAIAGAKVTVIDLAKNYTYPGVTDSLGRYLIRPLPPSKYTIRVDVRGFEPYQASGLLLTVNQNASLDIRLSLASNKQSVTVTSSGPVLATEDATTGQTIDTVFLKNLPLISREALDLAFLAPGVNPAPGNTFGTLSGEFTKNNFTSNGGRNATSDLLVDGVSVTGYEANTGIQVPLFSPNPDAIQEFKVEQNNFSAEFGYAGNTVVNLVTHSGGNEFHGSVFELYRNNALNANDYFDNQEGRPLGSLKYNDFGVSFGGPIRHNKTFFFVDYEGSRSSTEGSAFQAGVPSVAERTGNFGELCSYAGGSFDASGKCSAEDGQIWDPYTGTYDPNLGGPVREKYIPFNDISNYQSPGNPKLTGTPFQLPSAPGNLIDPVALKMMSYFPLPNKTANYNPYDNWIGNAPDIFQHDQVHIRIDQRFGEKNTLTGSFTWAHNPNQSGSAYNNPMDPRSQGSSNDRPTALAINDAHLFTSNTALTFAVGFTRNLHQSFGAQSKYPQFDPFKDLGLPSYLQQSGFNLAPAIIINGGYYSPGGWISLGPQPWTIARYAQQATQFSGIVTHVRGRHELRFGGEWRINQMNHTQPGDPNGMFNFDFASTSEFPASGGGDAMAGFLMGVSTAGNNYGESEIPTAVSTQNFRYAAFIQDNWHVNDKITLNLGFRYDIETPRTERHNKMEWFDPNIKSAISSIPCLSDQPCLTNLKGGDVYAHDDDRWPAQLNYKGFAPRLGLAYQLDAKTVVRSGYGIFYSPSEYGTAGSGTVGVDGYATTTRWINTYQGDGATPWGGLRNPFPAGLNLPFGNSKGSSTYLGGYVSGTVRNWNALPYTQTWNFGVQRQVANDAMLEINYVGTKGTHLYMGGAQELNHLGSWVEHVSPSEMAALQTYVNNPFYGVITDPSVPLSNAYIPNYQLYLPYPQFASIFVSPPPVASSTYHALQLRVQQRMRHGLQLLANYTWSKAIDNASVANQNTRWLGGAVRLLNPNDYSRERSVSLFDIPQVLNLAYVYELPFGNGRKWSSLHAWVNQTLGGWKTSGDWRFDNGQPIMLGLSGGTPIPGGYGQAPDLVHPLGRNHSSNWLNQYFANPQDAVTPAPYTLGNAPRALSSVRVPGTTTGALSLAKDFSLAKMREGANLEFMIETFNALNHPQFCGPNTTVGSPTLGSITAQCNQPRQVQFDLKAQF